MANITDNQLRGIALRKAYEKRNAGLFAWSNDDFKDLDPSIDFDINDLFRACEQLSEHNLIQFKSVTGIGGKILDGRVKITAHGIDVIEGHSRAPISINLDQSRHVTVTASSNVQVGDANKLEVHFHIESLLRAIDAAPGTPTEKAEAKNLLENFLKHPLVSAVVGGVVSGLSQ